jgi:hypothetical protein
MKHVNTFLACQQQIRDQTAALAENQLVYATGWIGRLIGSPRPGTNDSTSNAMVNAANAFCSKARICSCAMGHGSPNRLPPFAREHASSTGEGHDAYT